MSANALVAGAFFVLLFENLEHKVLFLGERNIPSRSVELHIHNLSAGIFDVQDALLDLC